MGSLGSIPVDGVNLFDEVGTMLCFLCKYFLVDMRVITRSGLKKTLIFLMWFGKIPFIARVQFDGEVFLSRMVVYLLVNMHVILKKY